MATKLNSKDFESMYFGDTPEQDPLVALGIIDSPKKESSGFSKVLQDYKTEKDKPSALEKVGGFLTGVSNTVNDIGDKTIDSFKGGLGRIKEAGEGLSNDKYTAPEAFARGGAGALQAFFSPVVGIAGEAMEEGVKALSDDFKANVIENVTPTVEGAIEWYNSQSPEQQRQLNNIGVGAEVLAEFVGGKVGVDLAKKTVSGIESGIKTSGDLFESGKKVVGEGVDTIKEKVSNIELPSFKNEDKTLKNLGLETEKGLINGIEVDVPKVERSLTQKVVSGLDTKTDKELAGRSVSPRTVGKNPKQKLKSIQDVENRTKSFYENVRTGKLEGDISTLENSAQTIVDNIDIVGARIGNAVKKVDGIIQVDNELTDAITTALFTKGSEVSPATPILKKFYDSLGEGNLTIDEAYELKKAYSNEVSKLYKSGDAGTKQYKALSDGVEFLNNKVDDIIENQLGIEFADDKLLYRELKTLVDDMVSSALVEGRKSPDSFAERIGKVESIFSPVNSIKQKLIKDADELNQRGGAWKELIRRYDEQSVKNAIGK